jgi:hypothetical protein
MQKARLLVYERKGTWAAALRREVPERVYELRSIAACWRELADRPYSFLLLELTAENNELLISRLADLDREYPGAAAVVIAERRLAHYEWPVREAGAVHFVVSPRCLRPLGGMIDRHWSSVPREDLPFAEQVIADLPWNSERA